MSPDPPQISWILPFVAGLVSFLSPCVIPLIPGYLSYVSGMSAEELGQALPRRTQRVLGQSILFVLGFAAIFVALGASASALGAALMQYRFVLNKVSGLFIIAMGLTLTGIVRVGWLTRERRVPLAARQGGALRSISLGAAFAFAWTPCIGPILASVLLYAGSVATVKVGALLLLVYALGLGVPFVLSGLAFSRAIHALRWMRRYARPIEAFSGIALIAIGTLLYTNKMFYVTIWAQRLFSRFGLDLWRFF